jgi:hypothetical protein
VVHVLTSKKAWALAAVTVIALSPPATAMSATPVVARQEPPRGLHLDFSGDPQGFGGVGRVTRGSGALVGSVYDLCNSESMPLRTDLIFCEGIIRLVAGKKGDISFEAAAPRPGVVVRYPVKFEGAITGGTGGFKGIRGQVNFTQTGPTAYVVSFDLVGPACGQHRHQRRPCHHR